MNELTPLSTEELMDMFERVDDRQCTERALAIYAELNRRSMLSAAALEARYGNETTSWWSVLWQLPLKVLFFPLGSTQGFSLLDAKSKVMRLAAKHHQTSQ
ncbi:hypothetical protein KJY73_08640 [Bowmanella sp. Y26]|uniref:hypothetical protein n=1 Tax=Bowmanella yangjiangensis TaxID=2811230 RepID=UPI001BDC42C5|nr:hypothetical protein [Bowmanella yangjiangensis]MBT1063638.1 hypothetical protein [Bowmanella yangjiangensis]